MSITYRSDIDGLRAVAVMPVVFFHADFAVLGGGFVGVDVFFVISGYLITSILFNDISNQRFSLVRFYERRCRRILPAILSVLIAVQVAGFFILLASSYVELSKSAIFTILFSSNIFFAQISSSYFDSTADFFPLLHTWSLAIEEQFYILFPILLLLLVSRLGRPATFWVVAALCGVSFAIGVSTTRMDPATAFYFTPARAWELGIGCLLALWWGRRPAARPVRELLATAGAAAIAVAVLTFDGGTPFPGVAATVPVMGAAAIIFAGDCGTTFIGRLLSLRPVVFLGLISYSLYLWHWPILVYIRELSGEADIPPGVALLAIGAAILLAIGSWAYVEAPFRRPAATGFSRPFVFGSSALAAAALAGTAAYSWIADGWPGRFPEGVLMAAASSQDFNPDRQRCFGMRPGKDLCTFPGTRSEDELRDFLLWGDSHADALMPGIAAAAEEKGLTGLAATKAACPPLLGIVRVDQRPSHDCDKFNDDVLALLRSRDDIPVVILKARWTLMAEGRRARGEAGKPALLARPGERSSGPAGNYALFRESLEATVSAIHQTGREVLLIGDVPEIGWNVPDGLLAHLRRGAPLPEAPTLEQVRQRQGRAEQALAEVGSLPGVHYLSVADELCRPVCRTHFEDGWALYFDDDHMSARGAREVVAPLVRHVFDELIVDDRLRSLVRSREDD